MPVSDFKEYVLLVHEVQHQPGGGKVSDSEYDCAEDFRNKLCHSAEEEIADLLKVNESLRQVNCYRVHADNLEENDAFSPAFYVNDIVENRENGE